jgi:hypothetical protein
VRLTDFYPGPAILRQNELGTLDLLSNDPYFAAEHGQFVADASAAYAQYSHRSRGFRFESLIDVSHKEMRGAKSIDPATGRPKVNLRLLIGSLIDQKPNNAFENISYFLVVSRIGSTPPTVLRKFHFDITPSAAGTRRQSHPLSHLQYCGKLTKRMEKLNYRPEHLKHMHYELSEPRVFFWPMSLALLIDLTLREFAEMSSYTFRQGAGWRNLVRRDEVLVLQKFHEECLAIIRNVASNRPTLSESFYVN